MKHYGSICLKCLSRIFKEIFRFCFVSMISWLIGIVLIGLLTEPPKGLFCGPCVDTRYPQISIYLECLWTFLIIIFFYLKKWAWSIDFFIVLLITLFLVPYILGIDIKVLGINIYTHTHTHDNIRGAIGDTLTSESTKGYVYKVIQ